MQYQIFYFKKLKRRVYASSDEPVCTVPQYLAYADAHLRVNLAPISVVSAALARTHVRLAYTHGAAS